MSSTLVACAVAPAESTNPAVDVSDPTGTADTQLAASRAALAADNAAILAQPAGSGSHCSIVLEKIQPGQLESRVVSYMCAETPAGLASIAPASSFNALLMEWWVDINFGGSGTQIWGKDGPCDSAGYGIVDTGFAWHDIISSFKSFSNCTRVSVYTRENYGGDTTTWWDPTGIGRIPAVAIYYVGNSFNDRIRSFHINRQD